MNAKRLIDLTTWNRRDHFAYYCTFDNPYWGITVDVDGTAMYGRAKQEGFPFSLGYFYATIRAVNEIDAFRQRLEDGKPVEFDAIHIGTTVDRPDGTYGFSCIPYAKDFDDFLTGGLAEVKRVRESTELVSGHDGFDVIYCTVLRGLPFTSMSQIYKTGSSIPLLAYGESRMENGRKMMPHNVHVNHAFVDGDHMRQYFRLLQTYLDEPR